MSCRIGRVSSLRVVLAAIAVAAFANLAWPEQSFGESRAQAASKPRGGAHLYVLLGFGNMSPGLSEFGDKIGKRGIPTTVRNHGDWQELAQEAIQQYKSGRLRSIMIVGHSLGGNAAIAMAAELGQSGIPVKLVATLDPVGDVEVPSNVRRSANIRPQDGEDHFSVISARERDLSSYVLGGKMPQGSQTIARRNADLPQYSDPNFTNSSNY